MFNPNVTCFKCGKTPARAFVMDPYIDMGYQLCDECIKLAYPTREQRLEQLEANMKKAADGSG